MPGLSAAAASLQKAPVFISFPPTMFSFPPTASAVQTRGQHKGTGSRGHSCSMSASAGELCKRARNVMRGVGKNMQDHYTARVSYPIVGAQTANEPSRGPPLADEVMRWLFTGTGMLTYSPSIIGASVKVLEESATPDMQCTFAPRQLQGRPDWRARGDARPERRRPADAAFVAWLCRGQVEPAGRGAGGRQPPVQH